MNKLNNFLNPARSLIVSIIGLILMIAIADIGGRQPNACIVWIMGFGMCWQFRQVVEEIEAIMGMVMGYNLPSSISRLVIDPVFNGTQLTFDAIHHHTDGRSYIISEPIRPITGMRISNCIIYVVGDIAVLTTAGLSLADLEVMASQVIIIPVTVADLLALWLESDRQVREMRPGGE